MDLRLVFLLTGFSEWPEVNRRESHEPGRNVLLQFKQRPRQRKHLSPVKRWIFPSQAAQTPKKKKERKNLSWRKNTSCRPRVCSVETSMRPSCNFTETLANISNEHFFQNTKQSLCTMWISSRFVLPMQLIHSWIWHKKLVCFVVHWMSWSCLAQKWFLIWSSYVNR